MKKIDGWVCECDWDGWSLCFELDSAPKDVPIKDPEKDGTYEVRTFDDGNYHEEESEFCTIAKNWGQSTNESISRWKIEYSDGWMGYMGVYAWKENTTDNA